jgi:lipopolysaccharide transport system ATP-binding protein
LSHTVISVENLSKSYRLGQIGTGTLSRDLKVWWARTRGKPNPLLRIGQTDHGNRTGEILWALKDVSFQVEQGEVLGIIGRNGAGKSTLLKILSRVTAPTSGCVKVKGRIASLLEVGTGFHPELTGRENIYLNGAILGMTKEEVRRRFDEIVAFAEIDKFIDTPVKRYSSGMYVRLAFAVAAHLESEILLVDEVLAVGDAEFQKKCLGKMGDVATQEGRTVLFVSHNMAAVSQLCRSAILLENGNTTVEGVAAEIIEKYLTRMTTQTAERVWRNRDEAPGDDRIRLRAARIRQENSLSPVININRSFELEMEFEVLKEVKNLVAAVNVNNSEGICLFSNADWRPNQLIPGTYFKVVTFPGQLLAEGRFSCLLQLVFFDSNIPSVVVPNALSFDTVDSKDPLSIRGYYKGHWPGLVRIGLKWSDATRTSLLSQHPGTREG